MKKIRLKQDMAFVVFLLAAAAMESELYITAGVLAIASITYLYLTIMEEKRYVYELRRKRTDMGIRRTEEPVQRSDLGAHQEVKGRRQA